ncbi:hypothetical protein ACFVKB_22070 [Rhodococcus sp. NPDC127530]|uniref:hypothetical protein n=1 Tax=unclassified Rhodococcus (in: high G+C Gram-positive bacteria) TaxID=192944 RepID=UPI00362F5795
MTKDFSSVSTSSASGPTFATGTSGPSNSGRKWVIPAVIGVVVLVVVALIIAVTSSGGGDDVTGSDAIRTAHGPNTIIDGVPRGYTRDQAGAQTAAVNFIQALGQTDQGRVDGAKLRELAVGSSPSTALTTVLDSASGREESKGTVNNVPLIVTVTDFTQDSATVSEWGMGMSQAPISADTDKVGILSVYATTTVKLVWEGDDWKAVDWTFSSGPELKDAQFPAADSPLAQQGAGGYYSFYVN